MLMKTLFEFAEALLELFFPKLCLACFNKNPLRKDLFCLRCKLELPYTDQIDIEDNELEYRIYGRFKFERAAALFRFRKESKVQKLMHQLKYKNRPHIGVELGKEFGKRILASKEFPIPDLIIPIPLHRKKQKKRGYNQSYQFGKGIAEELNIPIYGSVLSKISDNKSQTKMNRLERLENVLNSYKITDDSKIKGKHVLLVDDIITTGATIEAAAQKLLKSQDLKLSLALIGMAEL